MNGLILIYLGFLNLGPTEIVLVLLVAVLLFGGRLPEVARTLGKQFFDMKRNLKELQNDIYRQDVPPPRPIPKPYYRDPVEPDSNPPDPSSDENPYIDTEPVDPESSEKAYDETSSAGLSKGDSIKKSEVENQEDYPKSESGKEDSGKKDPAKGDPGKEDPGMEDPGMENLKQDQE